MNDKYTGIPPSTNKSTHSYSCIFIQLTSYRCIQLYAYLAGQFCSPAIKEWLSLSFLHACYCSAKKSLEVHLNWVKMNQCIYACMYSYAPGFLIRFLAWTKLVQLKLLLSHLLFIVPSNFVSLHVANTLICFVATSFQCYQHQLTIPAHFTLCHCGPSLIMALRYEASLCAIWCAIGLYQKHCYAPIQVYSHLDLILLASQLHVNGLCSVKYALN